MRGGGAKCAAYIGILKALEENDIKIDYIVGASGGAAIGGAYAAGKSLEEITEHFRKYSPRKYLGLDSLKEFSLFSEKKALNFSKELLGDICFGEAKIRFWAQATNVETLSVNYIGEGKISEAIVASSALPGLINPIDLDGKKYIDGEISGGYGVDFLKKRGAEVIIGMNTDYIHNSGKFENVYERFIAPLRISILTLLAKDQKLSPVDLLFDRLSVGVGVLDFDRVEEMALEGYELANGSMKDIKSLLFD
ncbi:MAG: hypothetical protein US52_C0004G0010 [candidate division WS6 bacterium GW2011_GWA2_37_6]|uniref:PNPLA domain-containing protein n=1 Tax=candidate division WS6 bacterium GW2011_GWA2_37_6 TaxID=1619087 RepID=A0A0G0JHI8_9BACT|nr:MAG: hypothetical protein US52_C0004G0010 [candidate division WS6 bacterium GW2011_GWA2_37_6]